MAGRLGRLDYGSGKADLPTLPDGISSSACCRFWVVSPLSTSPCDWTATAADAVDVCRAANWHAAGALTPCGDEPVRDTLIYTVSTIFSSTW